MNVLILTPDRVGSTLLQRVLTVQMAMHDYDKPVINLHELVSGLEYYHSDVYNQFVLGKPGINGDMTDWGFYQSMPEILELLQKVDHYKTSRLAHYYIIKRGDSITDQLRLYEYLNNNFFVIACQRKSVFEHVLSWGIKAFSKKLNVYTHQDKTNVYSKLFYDKVKIPTSNLLYQLDAYNAYIKWTNVYFNVNKFFVYEDNASNIDEFVQSLPIFNSQKALSWEEIFGISWHDWNKCHRLYSDLLTSPALPQLQAKQSSTELANIPDNMPLAEQNFVKNNAVNYKNTYDAINELVEDKTMVTNIPIKLQTLIEKKMMIVNFNELLDVYNNWAVENEYPIMNGEQIKDDAIKELEYWYENVPTKLKMLANS
jgi:hypothetical protein